MPAMSQYPTQGAWPQPPHGYAAPQQPMRQTQPRQAAQPAASSLPKEDLAWARETIGKVFAFYDTRMVGQHDLRTTLVTAMVAGGHVLLESVPGLAKTTAAKALADAVAGDFSRIQCTPDLLPSDIVGTQIYNSATSKFETRLGPVFANFVLLDEVNRSSAKTQAAMLEAMQERQVTIGDKTYPLSSDMFMVVATQNPVEQEGTYPLSEAQEDRFLFKETLSYPTPEEEIEILSRIESGQMTAEAEPVASVKDIRRLRHMARKVFVQPSLKHYMARIVAATRDPRSSLPPELARYVKMGASPRATIALLEGSKAIALVYGRGYVVADDVKYLCRPVLRHRITLGYSAVADGLPVEAVIDALVGRIPTP